MDAELLPVALAGAHLGRVLVRREDLGSALDVEPGVRDRVQQDVTVARVLGARVVRREQRVLELRLAGAGLEARPVQQPMRVERVPDARPVAEREADLGAALANDRARARELLGRRAVLARQVLGRVLAFGRHRGFSSNGSKRSSTGTSSPIRSSARSSDHRPTAHHGQATSETNSIFINARPGS